MVVDLVSLFLSELNIECECSLAFRLNLQINLIFVIHDDISYQDLLPLHWILLRYQLITMLVNISFTILAR